MVIRDELSKIISEFKQHGNDNPIFEAHLIVRHYLNMSPMELVLEAKSEIGSDVLERIESAVERRCANEPIQYIIGTQEFMGIEFYVNKDVLIPRQDTETLVECVLNRFTNKGFTGLDIGCGSGCISVSLAHYNKNAYMRGIDISENAVKTAEKNAVLNNVGDRTAFEQADIFNFDAYGKYDLIVSNPPYIKRADIGELDENVRLYEPHTALDGGEDGLDFYRRITQIAPQLLRNNGLIAFEIGIGQENDVGKMLCNNGFCDIETVKDLCGINRVVMGWLK